MTWLFIYIFKNNQIMPFHCLTFILKTGEGLPRQELFFTVLNARKPTQYILIGRRLERTETILILLFEMGQRVNSRFVNQNIFSEPLEFSLSWSWRLSFKGIAVKSDYLFQEIRYLYWLWYYNVATIFDIFQGTPMLSPIVAFASARAFYWCGWTWVYLE